MRHQLQHRRRDFTPKVDQNVEDNGLLLVVGGVLDGHKFQVDGP